MDPKEVHIVSVTLLCKIKKTRSKIIHKHGEIDLSPSNDITINLGHIE